MVFKVVQGDCPDRRVDQYYCDAADFLEATRMPIPGVRLQPTGEFLRFYRAKYGNTPFIAFPHGSGCFAWANDGGDKAGIQHAMNLAMFLHDRGIPSACLFARDGASPEYLYDGLSSLGASEISDRIQEMRGSPTSWAFNHGATAETLNVGHNFLQRKWRDALRLSSCFIMDETAPVVGAVVRHFADKVIPLHFSAELSERRRREIITIFDRHGLPIIVPNY